MSRPQRKGCDAGHVRHRVERESADLEASSGGTVDCQTSAMDISDDLKQGRQTARYPQLRRLPKTHFKRDSDADQVIDEQLMALRQPFGPLEEHPPGF
jgi:hypothetical protein